MLPHLEEMGTQRLTKPQQRRLPDTHGYPDGYPDSWDAVWNQVKIRKVLRYRHYHLTTHFHNKSRSHNSLSDQPISHVWWKSCTKGCFSYLQVQGLEEISEDVLHESFVFVFLTFIFVRSRLVCTSSNLIFGGILSRKFPVHSSTWHVWWVSHEMCLWQQSDERNPLLWMDGLELAGRWFCGLFLRRSFTTVLQELGMCKLHWGHSSGCVKVAACCGCARSCFLFSNSGFANRIGVVASTLQLLDLQLCEVGWYLKNSFVFTCSTVIFGRSLAQKLHFHIFDFRFV
jgi:hypothetical protein